jgi:hypothetical protein
MVTFKLTGDAEKIVKELEIFIEECHKEYDKQKVVTKKKLQGFKAFPIPADFELPEIILTYEKKDDNTVIFNSLSGMENVKIASVMGKIMFRGMRKKMEKNLKGYLNARGLDVKVSITPSQKKGLES